MPMDPFAGLHALVAAINSEKFRFLTAERHRAYAAILWKLLEHRRAHEIEVYYDDLLIEALHTVPAVEPGPYSPDAFRGDVKQLVDWGNLAPPRLEPRRIETLADRTLQKFLYRLDDETVAILEFLEGRSRAAAAALSDRGRHLLRDAAERLVEALRLARKLSRPRPSAESGDGDDLLRLSYLCLEVDGKVDAADYVIWRKSQNQTGPGLAADSNGDGIVNVTDYNFWRSRVGTLVGTGNGFGGTIPEPTCAALLMITGCAAAFMRSTRFSLEAART